MTEPPIQPAGVTDGCSNPIIGGGGALVYPSIHSPNFSLGPPIVGWSIDKNGNAYFSGTIGGNGYEITTSGFFLYNGTPGPGTLIASITPPGVTEDQYSNPVDNIIAMYGSGTNAAKYIREYVDAAGNPRIDVGSGLSDEYSTGNIISSVNNKGLANQYLIMSLGSPINTNKKDSATILFQSSPDDSSGSAGINFAYTDTSSVQTDVVEIGSGGCLVNLPQDQAQYDVARKTMTATGQLISSGSYTAVLGLTGRKVGILEYQIRAIIKVSCVTNSNGAAFNFTGPAIAGAQLEWRIWPIENSSTAAAQPYTYRTTGTLTGLTGPAMTVSQNWTFEIEGNITFSATGTFGIQAASGSGVGSYNIITQSTIVLEPLTSA